MIKSKFKKIGIVVLVLVGIFALLTFGDWIISKIQGLDVRIKFEATNTEVKVTSVMYGNDEIDFRDEDVSYNDNTLQLKKHGIGTKGANYYKITLEAYGKESVFFIMFIRTSNRENDLVWKQNMVIEITNGDNEELSIIPRENDNCEFFHTKVEDNKNWIVVTEIYPAIH